MIPAHEDVEASAEKGDDCDELLSPFEEEDSRGISLGFALPLIASVAPRSGDSAYSQQNVRTFGMVKEC